MIRPHPFPRLGNDVVDLSHRRSREWLRETRFIERVLADTERAWLEAGSPGSRTIRLWTIWAAKEAGYKVLCKAMAKRPVFLHRDFRARLELSPEDEGIHVVSGTIEALDHSVELSGWASGAVVHVTATGGGSEGAEPRTAPRIEMGIERLGEVPAELLDLEALRPQFTDAEWAGIHSAAGARARLLARARLQSHLRAIASAEGWGSTPPRIEILTSAELRGRTPPRVVVDGDAMPELDVSLSHHGDYVAWALLLPGRAAGG